MMRKTLIAACCTLAGVFALVTISYVTTHIHWYGWTGAGEARLRVVDEAGKAISGATVTLLYKGGLLASELYTNYRGPGSVQTGADGELVLELRELPAGGESWRVLWLYEVEPENTVELWFWANGYQPGSIREEHLLEAARNNTVLTVVLKSSWCPGDVTSEEDLDR